MFRTLVATGVFAVAGFAGLAAAPAASADPLCQTVTVDTIATSPTTVGPVCVPYGGAPECVAESDSADPFIALAEEVCLPGL